MRIYGNRKESLLLAFAAFVAAMLLALPAVAGDNGDDDDDSELPSGAFSLNAGRSPDIEICHRSFSGRGGFNESTIEVECLGFCEGGANPGDVCDTTADCQGGVCVNNRVVGDTDKPDFVTLGRNRSRIFQRQRQSQADITLFINTPLVGVEAFRLNCRRSQVSSTVRTENDRETIRNGRYTLRGNRCTGEGLTPDLLEIIQTACVDLVRFRIRGSEIRSFRSGGRADPDVTPPEACDDDD